MIRLIIILKIPAMISNKLKIQTKAIQTSSEMDIMYHSLGGKYIYF